MKVPPDKSFLRRIFSVMRYSHNKRVLFLQRVAAYLLVVLTASVLTVVNTSHSSAMVETIYGTVKSTVTQYNITRYKARYDGVGFTGDLDKAYCEFRGWNNSHWNSDVLKIPYGTWSLGLRYAANDQQFSRLEFYGQHGSGSFPETGGALGDYDAYFKINTKGSTCTMDFSGSLHFTRKV